MKASSRAGPGAVALGGAGRLPQNCRGTQAEMPDPGLVPGAGGLALRVCFPGNGPRGDGLRRRGGRPEGGAVSWEGGRCLRSRRGAGTGHLAWAPVLLVQPVGAGERSSRGLRADGEGARGRRRVRWAKVGGKWVRRGVGQGARGAHAPPPSTEGRPEVAALEALGGRWAATWESGRRLSLGEAWSLARSPAPASPWSLRNARLVPVTTAGLRARLSPSLAPPTGVGPQGHCPTRRHVGADGAPLPGAVRGGGTGSLLSPAVQGSHPPVHRSQGSHRTARPREAAVGRERASWAPAPPPAAAQPLPAQAAAELVTAAREVLAEGHVTGRRQPLRGVCMLEARC